MPKIIVIIIVIATKPHFSCCGGPSVVGRQHNSIVSLFSTMRSKKRNFNGLDYETHEPESQLKGGGYRGGPKVRISPYDSFAPLILTKESSDGQEKDLGQHGIYHGYVRLSF